MNVPFGLLTLLGGFLGGIAGKAIYLHFASRASRRRDERFLRYVRIHLPESEVIEFITVGPNEKQVIDNIERRIRELPKHR